MGMLVIVKDLGVFQDNKEMELSTGKILEENMVQSAFQQTLGDRFTFQQDKNLNIHWICLPRQHCIFLSGLVTVLTYIRLTI